jgi:hypothetical protein
MLNPASHAAPAAPYGASHGLPFSTVHFAPHAHTHAQPAHHPPAFPHASMTGTPSAPFNAMPQQTGFPSQAMFGHGAGLVDPRASLIPLDIVEWDAINAGTFGELHFGGGAGYSCIPCGKRLIEKGSFARHAGGVSHGHKVAQARTATQMRTGTRTHAQGGRASAPATPPGFPAAPYAHFLHAPARPSTPLPSMPGLSSTSHPNHTSTPTMFNLPEHLGAQAAELGCVYVHASRLWQVAPEAPNLPVIRAIYGQYESRPAAHADASPRLVHARGRSSRSLQHAHTFAP